MKVKDVRQGVTVFISHPVYGIEELQVTSKPYISPYTNSLFANSRKIYDDGFVFEDNFSLRDAGITPGESYNYRRTFFKRKHAEEWASKMINDPGFIRHHDQHVRLCNIYL